LAAARHIAEHWRPGEADPRANLAAVVAPSVSSGSGFIVSHAGDVVTNNHVVRDCRAVQVVRDGRPSSVTLVGADQDVDLAILRLPEPEANPASLRVANPVRAGETVVVVGFPLQGLLTSEPTITTGIVSVTKGPHDDQRLLQLTAPVQPGSSGGPVIDPHGTVIGIVMGKLNGSRVAELTGQAPEGISFAINAQNLQALLDKHRIRFETSAGDEILSVPEIAEQARNYAVMVRCLKPP
jgi:S1-C subfamily serine protease